MVQVEVLQKRIAKLKEYIGLLQRLKKYGRDKFKKDPFIHGNAERYLQLAIQCMLDIGNHIISDQNLGEVNEYRDVFIIMGENGILPKDFANRISSMAGFRNILVHEYLELNLDQVYENLQENLDDFKKFMVYLKDYLGEG